MVNNTDSKTETSCKDPGGKTMSIERQVRIVAGLLVLLGIALAYTIYPPLIWISITVALGMVISGTTNSCALGLLLEQLPWNRE